MYFHTVSYHSKIIKPFNSRELPSYAYSFLIFFTILFLFHTFSLLKLYKQKAAQNASKSHFVKSSEL